ncbi:hypothetical protein AN644_00310 [Candidatus Epulonipiscium fishelsonii]|nr:hypothetical protein AN644_00310 [Epulopiscium sp. SCG-C06WGA-EpuloA1]
MFWTTIPASIISLIVYSIVGLNTNVESVIESELLTNMISNFESLYSFNLYLLIPILIILIGSIMRLPSIPVMLLSVAVAGILAMIFQGISINDLFTSIVNGFNINMIDKEGLVIESIIPEVSKLVTRGGLNSMMGVALITFCAFSFSGVLASTSSLEVILENMMQLVKKDGTLVFYTVISTILMAFTVGSVHLTILLPGELFKDIYAKRGLAPENLSRTLEDAGTIIMPIVPWSLSGVYMVECLGVDVFAFMPWAILCYLCFILAIIYGYTGIGIKRISTDSNI